MDASHVGSISEKVWKCESSRFLTLFIFLGTASPIDMRAAPVPAPTSQNKAALFQGICLHRWRWKQEVPTKRFQKTSSHFDMYVWSQFWRVGSLGSKDLENRKTCEKSVRDINCACPPHNFCSNYFSLPSVSGKLRSGCVLKHTRSCSASVYFPPRTWPKLLTCGQVLLRFLNIQFHKGTRGVAVGWGTMLKAGRSRVRFPMSLDFSIQSFQPYYGLGVDSASNRNDYRESSLGVERGRRHLWAYYLQNVGASKADNPMGLYGLFQGQLFIPFF
jgi:hypothetical protein